MVKKKNGNSIEDPSSLGFGIVTNISTSMEIKEGTQALLLSSRKQQKEFMKQSKEKLMMKAAIQKKAFKEVTFDEGSIKKPVSISYGITGNHFSRRNQRKIKNKMSNNINNEKELMEVDVSNK